MEQENISMTGMCETRLKDVGDGTVHNNHRLIYSRGGDRKGVAFLVESNLVRATDQIIQVDERILCISLMVYQLQHHTDI